MLTPEQIKNIITIGSRVKIVWPDHWSNGSIAEVTKIFNWGCRVNIISRDFSFRFLQYDMPLRVDWDNCELENELPHNDIDDTSKLYLSDKSSEKQSRVISITNHRCFYFNPMYMYFKCDQCEKNHEVICFDCTRCKECHSNMTIC